MMNGDQLIKFFALMERIARALETIAARTK